MRPGPRRSSARWFAEHAGPVALLATLVSGLALAALVDFREGTLRLEIDPSSDRLLPEDGDARRVYDRVRALFGEDETLVVALASDDAFGTDAIERIVRLTERLEAVPGVQRVLSLANAVRLRGVPGGVEIEPFLRDQLDEPEALRALRSELLADPLYGPLLSSPDGSIAVLHVYFDEMSNREFLARDLDGRIRRIAEAERGPAELWITGGPHIRAATARILLGESWRLSVMIGLVLAGVLALATRSARGVVLPLVTVAAAVLWTLAIVSASGFVLNAVTALLPPLLVAVGLSYATHVVSAFEEGLGEPDAQQADPVELIARMLPQVAPPVLLTAATTAIGFGSLGLSPFGAVREFGLFAALGTALAAVASLTITPSVLALLPRSQRESRSNEERRRVSFERIAERVARFDLAHRRSLFLAAAGALVVSIWGVQHLRVGTQQIGKFRSDAPVRRDFEAVNRGLSGANPFIVVVDAEAPDAFKEPANLRALEALQGWLLAQPEVGGVTSLVDYVKLLHRGFSEGDPGHYSIPESRRLVGQLLFLAGSEELDRFVDSYFQTAALRVRTRVIDSDDVAALTARIEARLAELPGRLEGHVTGTPVVFAQGLDEIVRGQAISVVAALGVIYAVLSLLFVSLRIGAVALLPNVLPVAAYYGFLGVTGIRLDPGTSLVAPMVIGIAVDDTIHFFMRFVRETRRTADESLAVITAAKTVGRPMTVTSLTLCVGFLVLTTSELRSQVETGLVAAFALGFAWLVDVTLTPALCGGLRIATLWDVLRVDLGPEPERAIALFRGLRPGQARIVALMARIVELRGGDRLFDAGDPGHALYVVIEGCVRLSLAHPRRGVEVARPVRGEVFGEVGLFHAARSVDAVALEDTRLLRVSADALARLARRYPRIAARVGTNLNGILAARFASASVQMQLLATSAETLSGGTALAGSTRREALARAGRGLERLLFGAGGAEERSDDERLAVGALGPEESWVVRHLLDAGASGASLAGLALVPLVEVAWADGIVDEREREAVFAGARACGLRLEGVNRDALERALRTPVTPELRAAWREFAREVAAALSQEARSELRAQMLGHARAVAAATGGFLGVGTVSRDEERTLRRLEAEIDPAQ